MPVHSDVNIITLTMKINYHENLFLQLNAHNAWLSWFKEKHEIICILLIVHIQYNHTITLAFFCYLKLLLLWFLKYFIMYFLIEIIKEKIVQYRIDNILKCSYAHSSFLLANGLSFAYFLKYWRRADCRPYASERSWS